MRRQNILWLISLSLIFCMPLSATLRAQQCGDLNVSGVVNVADYLAIYSYILLSAPPPPNRHLGDIDSYEGLTLRDVSQYAYWIWGGGPPLLCDSLGPPIIPTESEDYVVEYDYLVPDIDSKIDIPLTVRSPSYLSVVTLPLQVIIDGVVMEIDTVIFDDTVLRPGGWAYESREESGSFMIGALAGRGR